MKVFITLKVGYTHSKMYGLSGEYFTTIIISDLGISSVNHYGMYGSEERVNKVLKEAGFTEHWIPSDYGLMISKDIPKKLFLSEDEAINWIKDFIATSSLEKGVK